MSSDVPLSFAQQRLWFLDQLTPGLAHYNTPVVFDVDGPLDSELLRRVLNAVVERHEALRTVFVNDGGVPLQRVLPHEPLALAQHDISGLASEDRAAALDRLIDDAIRQPFDLTRGPLLRGTIVRMSATHHALVAVVHHIAVDGLSSAIIFREVAALYGAFGQEQPSPLAPLPVRYSEYALEQRAWLAGEHGSRQVAYWLQQLAPPVPTLQLPTDRPRPREQSFAGHRCDAVLSAATGTALQQLARSENVTPFMLFAATYALLLSRLTGQHDIIVGAAIGNRNRPGLESMVGFLANTLALRIDLSQRPTFRELLARVRRTAIGAYANQDLPFDRLVEELNPNRTLARMPLVQAVLTVDSEFTPDAVVAAGDVVFRRRSVFTGTAKFDMQLRIWRGAAERKVVLDVNADIFDLTSAERMLREFCQLAELLPSRANDRIDEIPGIPHAAAPSPAGRTGARDTVHGLFEAQAARTPHADAVLCGHDRVSYTALNALANQIAAAVRRHGVAPDDRVGVCLHRSPRLLAAVLGVLKSGAAYVPLDPAYPGDRLSFMVADAGCRLVVTEQSLLSIAEPLAAPCVVVEAVAATSDAATVPMDRVTVAPDSLAYVIYTSGSTGVPKGVAIEHRQVTNLVSWALTAFSADERAGMLASTSASFDLSVFEWFVPLCSGGAVILVDHLLALPQAPARDRVTFVNSVPSLVREWLDIDRLPPNVGVVAMAGEALPTSLVQRVYQQPPVKRVFDLYGPTETTVYATAALRLPDGPCTIGRPIANTTALVLDDQGNAVPSGEVGELYIGGAGVARGYLGRDDQTRERFVTMANGARVYRTGDRVRSLPDGALEFLGRADRQFKFHGYRIEPGEIEAVLTDLPAIIEAAVFIADKDSGAERLAAIIVVNREVDDQAIYAHLETRLPHFMVPSLIVRMERLPRTVNGKIDWHELRAQVSRRLYPAEKPAAGELEWADHPTDYPRDLSVPQLFQQRAILAPEAIAAVADGVEVSYRELNDRANRLARHLRERLTPQGGSQASSPLVGVLLPRSLEAIVAMLAVLKAGAAYVPFDPTWPPARVNVLVESIGLDAVIVAGDSRSLKDVASIDLVRDRDVIDRQPASDIAPAPAATTLAYVMFTSGTTGQPKAVGVPHRAIVRLAFGLGDVALAGVTTAHIAPLAFDASTFEIWCPLLRGGTVAVAPDGLLSTEDLGQLIARNRVKTLFLTSSLFNALIDDDAHVLDGVTHALVGGEAMSARHARTALTWHPALRLYNAYGPTESTTFATLYPVDAASIASAASVPIGRPIGATRVYVLDDARALAPQGTDGQLWLGGDGLAVGYLNDATLTAERFVADPFSDHAGARMYATGDRVRWRGDGVLEFLGRIDDQVKIRGHRIEPGEVEAAIARQPHVLQTAVVATELPAIGRALAAFVVLSTELPEASRAALLERGLSAALSAELPSQMVPTIWRGIEALPLTSTNKVDRRALAALAAVPERTTTPTDVPAADSQSAVAAIFGALLGTTGLDASANFFRLGGHSLLATQAVARIKATLHTGLDLRTFFSDPTVGGVAAAVDRLRASSAATATTIPRASRTRPIPLSYAQRRIWFMHQWHEGSAAYNMPEVFRLEGEVDFDRLRRSLQVIVNRHEGLRTTFPLVDGEPVQRVTAHLMLPFTVFDVTDHDTGAAEIEAQALLASEAARRFDLAVDPLIRAMVIRVTPTATFLMLSLHHIVADGWSLGVLLRELDTLYRHDADAAVLPPLPVQYLDYAEWQRAALAGPLLNEQLEFWRRQLRPPIAELTWPVEDRRRDSSTAPAGRVRFEVGGIREPLLNLCTRTETTPFMVVLAALQTVLGRYTGQDDVLTGTPTAQRTRPELEGVIGCFVNTLVMRGDLSGDPTFVQLLSRTRQVVLDGQAHQDMPFDVLVDALKTRRSALHAPMLQVLLAYNDGLESTPSLGGLKVSHVNAGQESAKFEMGFHVRTRASGLQATLQYDAGLFDAGFARAVAADVASLLETAVREPGRRLSEFRLEGTDQRLPALTAEPFTAPRTEGKAGEDLEQRLQLLWSEVLGIRTVTLDANFFDLGGTSLKAVRLFTRVEEQWGIRLPLSSLFRHGTLRSQAALLAAQLGRDATLSPVVAIRATGRRPPVFIVNGGAGELVSFGTLAARLDPDQPVFGLQPDYGHDYASDRLEDVAARYVAALRQHTPHGPYHLAGYCTGAALAFEIAQQLTRAGEHVATVVIIDGLAPGLVQTLTPQTLKQMLGNAVNWWQDDEFARTNWAGRRRWVWHRLRVRFVRWQRARAQGQDALPEFPSWIVTPGARRFAQQYVRAFEAYNPSRYEGRVDVIRARTMGFFYRGPEDLGWGALASRVTTTQLVGTHNTILKEPLVRDLAAALTRVLNGE